MQKKVFQLLVDNTSCLSRISGLFSRRGYNIESITAGVTADARITRITIGFGDAETQIEKQVGKLEDVRDVKVEPEIGVCRAYLD